ncbi:MAG: hypothetical protein WCU88_08880 [Elusimicrobiota bacterium]|jgi:hypothetical protein
MNGKMIVTTQETGASVSRRSSSGEAFGAKEIADEAVPCRSSRERWLSFMKLVYEKYPFCTMYGVHVENGIIISCKNIQRSLLFGDSNTSPVEPGPELFDAKWQALETLCTQLGSGTLAELKFGDAKPLSAKIAEAGRRFKHFHRQEG